MTAAGLPLRVSRTPRRTAKSVLTALLILACCAALAGLLPRPAWHDLSRPIVAVFGLVGLWRYGWWLTHFVRARIYLLRRYPALAADAGRAWRAGWRPSRVHIIMTVYRETPEIADAVARGICAELRAIARPAVIWIGSQRSVDERCAVDTFRRHGSDLDIDLRIIRQNVPGKRAALALLLRAVSRQGLGSDDTVVFLDGDFVLEPGALQKTLPLFAIRPGLHAVTTDEDVIVRGPRWMQSWLSMRFAQRRIAMQSHALSGRVLTLTGRFSIFRATHITCREFIRLMEADHLSHWLWGRFRFLSGDDKSTWYALLGRGVEMLYVPDASGYTVEVIDGSGRERMLENIMRWTGNSLRNGARALALGPRRMPIFIWWCLLDQRLAMWTTLLGPLIAILGTIQFGPPFLALYALYVVVTRLVVALLLFTHARRPDFNFIWTLYANQLLTAAVKLYLLWRLPRQRWANRGDQRQSSGGGPIVRGVRHVFAAYLTSLSLALLVLVAMLLTGSFGRHG